MRTVAFGLVVLVATALFVMRGIAGKEGDFSAEKSAVIDAGRARQVRVEGDAGALRVLGVAGTSQVRVKGTARASRSRLLGGMRLELVNDGQVVTVRVAKPSRVALWFGRSPRRSMDLTVEVPAGLEADVRSGTGDAEVRGVSAARIVDGSGDLRVSEVHGPVRVTDGSGELTLERIGGDLWIEDGSGEVSVRGVEGSVVVANDGSGALTLREVSGDVVVQHDGSGEIDVDGVGGSFTVQHDGSGAIREANVRGPVVLPKRKQVAAEH